MARGEKLIERNYLHPLERVQLGNGLNSRDRCHFFDLLAVLDGTPSNLYSRTPIQCVKGWGLPAAASYTIPAIFSTSGTKTSHPPKPQIKPTRGGRLALAYKAARTSVASTPLR